MKRVVSILLVVLLVLAAACTSSLLTVRWMEQQYAAEANSDPVKFKMERIFAMLDTYFIDEYDKQTLEAAAVEGAAKAMIEATGDKWSYYVSPEDTQSFEEQLHNSYVGIGVTILEVDEGVEIMEVLSGGPAEEAGIQVGDICIAVDGESIAGFGTEGTRTLVLGEEGTLVNLTFQRDGEEFEVTVERRAVVMPVANLEMLEDGIALITIKSFGEHCAGQTLTCIEDALEQDAKALLFDVRFNPGGMKEEMNVILDYLLPEGDLFRSVDYLDVVEVDKSDARCLDMPMAVLVNEDSFSAAEFFAAALQEYDWAEIVGVQTSGKGNFQYPLDVGDGSVLMLSCGKYFTPNGVSLTDVGITPDIIMDLSFADYERLYYGVLAHEDDEQMQAGLAVLREELP